MNTNERNEMVKPEELNIMPEAVQEVKATDENPVDETKQKVEVVENINDLSLEMGEDDEEIEEKMQMILEMMMPECTESFEKLPIFDYRDILRNILYSGVWTRYEMVKRKRRGER